MHHKSGDLFTQFAQEVALARPGLDRAALLLTGVVNDSVDLVYYLDELDRIAAVVEQALPRKPGRTRALALLETLHDQIGFIGNQTDYYDPRNSYLTHVLERRTGLPILLSLVYMAVGRRLHLQVEGIGLPLHFMVRYTDSAGAWLLDPFYGRLLLIEEAETYLSGVFKQRITIAAQSLNTVSVHDMIQRILVNLRNVYVNSGHYAQAARIVDHILLLAPNNASWWQERAVFHYHSHEWERSVRDIRHYFFLTGRLTLALDAMGDDEDKSKRMLNGLSSSDRYLLDLLKQIEDLRLRLN